MKAALLDRFGALTIREVAAPQPGPGEVLVSVRASSLNAVDWYTFSGHPLIARPMTGLRGPRSPELGTDFAGVVEAVGEGVEDLRAGDEVFGVQSGALSEAVVAKKAVARMPANLSFEEAAAVPVAALAALQGLRDHGQLQAGQRVLVHGASGGVGTFAVQIANALGAEVHAVCRTANVEQARELGASRVFDYTQEDFTRSGERYDVLLDNSGNRPWRAMRRALVPRGTAVLVGGPRKALLGPLGHVAGAILGSKLGKRRAVFFIAKPNPADLGVLRELIESGAVRPVIERRYTFGELAEAMRAMDGHARAKYVIAM